MSQVGPLFIYRLLFCFLIFIVISLPLSVYGVYGVPHFQLLWKINSKFLLRAISWLRIAWKWIWDLSFLSFFFFWNYYLYSFLSNLLVFRHTGAQVQFGITGVSSSQDLLDFCIVISFPQRSTPFWISFSFLWYIKSTITYSFSASKI